MSVNFKRFDFLYFLFNIRINQILKDQEKVTEHFARPFLMKGNQIINCLVHVAELETKATFFWSLTFKQTMFASFWNPESLFLIWNILMFRYQLARKASASISSPVIASSKFNANVIQL